MDAAKAIEIIRHCHCRVCIGGDDGYYQYCKYYDRTIHKEIRPGIMSYGDCSFRDSKGNRPWQNDWDYKEIS
jgi:hypothetical protein